MSDEVRWVASYERVSSEDQRERETIRTQTDAIDRYLNLNPNLRVYRRYQDDGVSGKVPFADRREGSHLLRDAQAGRFTEVLITRADRLGRDKIDLMITRERLNQLGIKLTGVSDNIDDTLSYDIRAVISDDDRRRFLARSAEGMNRAAREGRYTGGIVPIGYKVEGRKQTARLVPSDIVIWSDWTEAHLVRHIYRRLAVDGWSCRKIADELNALGVPTAYQKDGRGVRGKRTQCRWRAGRIRNLVVNTVYKGELQYGRRSNRPDREPIPAPIEPLVSEEIWDAAQATLAKNRIMAKNGRRTYLLRSVIVCGTCGLHYCGCSNRENAWYRCDGQLIRRALVEGRCPSKSIKGEHIEPLVWADVERWLRNPGDLIDELAAERNGTAAAAVAEAERTTLETALAHCDAQRDRMLDLYQREVITLDELEPRLNEIKHQRERHEERLQELEPSALAQVDDLPTEDLLAEIRRRLDEGFDDEQRQEIVQLLVRRITINTEVVDGQKQATAVVEYRFPGVVNTSTDRGSWPPPA